MTEQDATTTSKPRGTRKVRTGVVVSDKMDKTVVVEVEDIRQHRLYQKTIRRTTRLKAHDEQNTYKVGDKVRIVETRPLSKRKCWRVQGKVRAERMVVSGVLSGSIHAAELLEVHASARIEGELRYGALEVQPGARLEVTLACEAPAIATVAADTRLPERAEALLLPAPRAA